VHRICVVLLATALLATAGCDDLGSTGPDSPEELARHLQQARDFKPYGVYWLGESFEGKELSAIAPRWGFYYGECTETETGCVYDPTIGISGVCKTRRTGLPRKKHGYRLIRFRGAVATWNRFQPGLTVLTGRSIVHLDGERGYAFSQARSLRPVSSVDPVEKLEPPAPGSLKGDLPCQRRVAKAEREQHARQVAKHRATEQ
jgi:hypothetical protein